MGRRLHEDDIVSVVKIDYAVGVSGNSEVLSLNNNYYYKLNHPLSHAHTEIGEEELVLQHRFSIRGYNEG